MIRGYTVSNFVDYSAAGEGIRFSEVRHNRDVLEDYTARAFSRAHKDVEAYPIAVLSGKNLYDIQAIN